MKAVVPAAGLGTRLLPATRAVPKEMLPILDRPLLEYALDEAAAAGITGVVVVVSEDKDAIRRHLAGVAGIEYVVQREPLGLGHAVAVAGQAVGDEPFAVLLPDEIVDPKLLRRMLDIHDEREASVIGLLEVPPDALSAYGVPEVEPAGDAAGDAAGDVLMLVRAMVEKPAPEEAPSRFATIGRYVFTPEILDVLSRVEPGHGGEIQLTDAIDLLAKRGPVYGAVIEEGRWDVGNTAGMLGASIELALDRDDLADEVRKVIADLARRHGLA